MVIDNDNDQLTNCSKNNASWNAVFKALPILDEIKSYGIYEITAEQLSKYGNRQPRLMAKIESVYNLPKIFKDNNLCIMPNKNRGNYIIGHFDAFQNVEFNSSSMTPKKVQVEQYYDTLNPFNIQREPTAILAAYNNGILDDLSGNYGSELRMTNFGRVYTEPFTFKINNKISTTPYNISVEKSQLEMDGVFESDDAIINIEAKCGLRTNFLIRQLYYPYRYLENQSRKEIINVFLTCSTGSIYTHIFHVDNKEDYNSMRLIDCHRYDFYEEITISEVTDLIRNTNCMPDPSDLIIPQADSIEKVFDSLEIIERLPGITDNELGYELSIVNRQGGYYGNACNYLGLTFRKKNDGRSFNNYITSLGREILSMPYKERILAIIKQMLRHEVFNHFLKEYIEQSRPPTKKEIEEWLKDNIPKMRENGTPSRRSGTIKNWINWVIKICNADV